MIYTKKGDAGTTAIADGRQLSKADQRICAIGSVDELNCVIGMILTSCYWADDKKKEKKFLENVQEDLFVIGAKLSCSKIDIDLEPERIALIEEKIDELSAELEPLKNFILPGGLRIRAGWYHIARAVCRRAEREVVATEEVDPIVKVYLNRLSDLLFIFARYDNDKGKADAIWSGKGQIYGPH